MRNLGLRVLCVLTSATHLELDGSRAMFSDEDTALVQRPVLTLEVRKDELLLQIYRRSGCRVGRVRLAMGWVELV